MHRPAAYRPLLGRQLSRLHRIIDLEAPTRPFSTTFASRAADNDDAQRSSSSRRRGAEAAEILSSMQPRTIATSQPSRPVDARSLGSSAADGNKPITPGNVINLRSLPRRGGSGASFPGPSGVSTPSFRPRRADAAAGSGASDRGSARGGGRERGGFQSGRIGGGGGGELSSSNAFSRDGGGNSRGRGSRGRGGRGRRGGGGGGGGGGGMARRNRDNFSAGDRGQYASEADDAAALEDIGPSTWTAEAGAYLDGLESGVETVYRPSSTLEDLVGHAPAVVSSSSKMGTTSSVMRSMRVLGGGVPFAGDLMNPLRVKERAEKGETIFFDNAAERQFAKTAEGGEYAGPSEATKQAIMDAVVQGKYTAPQHAAARDTIGTLQSYFARDGTYQANDGKAFEEKVRSLLPAKSGKAGKAKGPRA